MTATAHPESVTNAVLRILRDVRDLLPVDTLWILDESPDGSIYHITFFGDIEDREPVFVAAERALEELLEKEMAFALIFDNHDALHHLPEDIRAQSLDWTPTT